MNIGREMVEEVGLEADCCIRASVQVCRGAGIFTAEGIPDFRGASGLFKLRDWALCEADGCSGELESSVVLLEAICRKASAWKHTNRADFALVHGSSLKVAPARAMPGQVAKIGGRLVIINLQFTQFDGQASLVIYVRCDEVMRLLVKRLQLKLQPSLSKGENQSSPLEGSASQT